MNHFGLPDELKKCSSPEIDLTLADRSVVLPYSIGKVWFDCDLLS